MIVWCIVRVSEFEKRGGILGIKIKKKTSGLDENTPRVKIARASSGGGGIKSPNSGGLKVGYSPTGSNPSSSSSKDLSSASSSSKSSTGGRSQKGTKTTGAVLAGSKFKLSIAPNMQKVNCSNLSNGVINEYDRLADEFKNKNIDKEKKELNQY